MVSVTPLRPGHVVVVEYRVDGGPIRRVNALPAPADPPSEVRSFQAVLPSQVAGVVEFLPVLLEAGRHLSPRLAGAPEASSRYRVTPAPEEGLPAARSDPGVIRADGGPLWAWNPQWVGTLTARLRKEVVGPTPEGLRINWHVVEGRFSGPGLEAIICPGATDWMRIRQDGVGIVEVRGCYQTPSGARIFASYGGTFDLGPDGYARALRNEFDPLPPLVVTPTYATADPELAWLNRAQCIGVGRVNVLTQEVSIDVYRIDVGGRLVPGGGAKSSAASVDASGVTQEDGHRE